MIDEATTRRIREFLDGAPVVLFMKGTPDFPQCGFSAQTAGALRALKANYRHVNIFEEPELREALKAYSNWPTYPQLYVKGELVGGCDIVTEMYQEGELQQASTETNDFREGVQAFLGKRVPKFEGR